MKTKKLTEVLERVETWPADAQNELAEFALELDAGFRAGEYEPTNARVLASDFGRRRIFKILSNAGFGTLAAKKHHNFCAEISLSIRGPHMRTSHAILLGSIAAFAVLTAPALAKTSNTQPTETTPVASSGCYSSQQNADGSWTERPCQELGQPAPPAPHKSAARNVEPATR
jgi:hypothetical protein